MFGADAAARGVAGRLRSQLARVVAVVQERSQDPGRKDGRAARRYALAVERRAAQAAGQRTVVDDRDELAPHMVADAIGEPRVADGNVRSCNCREDVTEHRSSYVALEDDGGTHCRWFARAEHLDGSSRSDTCDHATLLEIAHEAAGGAVVSGALRTVLLRERRS